MQVFDRDTGSTLPTLHRETSPYYVDKLNPLVPALAIPATGKSEFICPKNHLESLRKVIPHVTKIVIVGWRAAEQHFLTMLAEGLGDKNVKVLAVSGGVDGAKGTLRALENAGIKGDFQPDTGGFSDFVVNNRVEAFLAS